MIKRILEFDDYEPYYSFTLPEDERDELCRLDEKRHNGVITDKEKERMDFLFSKCLEEDTKLEEEHNKSYLKIYNETLKKIREK